jgi:hypothetical protein
VVGEVEEGVTVLVTVVVTVEGAVLVTVFVTVAVTVEVLVTVLVIVAVLVTVLVTVTVFVIGLDRCGVPAVAIVGTIKKERSAVRRKPTVILRRPFVLR